MTGSCFADELEVVKKISSAKDLELDHMQLKVKAVEGEYMCIGMHACMCALMVNGVSLFNVCAHTFELSLFHQY